MSYSRSISILGCGWLGETLREQLDSEGYAVQCLGRDVGENRRRGYYHCDTLVIAIPPRENYLEVLGETLSCLDRATQVILLSSISCYDGKEMVVAGEWLVCGMREDAVVLRLGGLMGYDRIAGRYTAGRRLSHDSMSNYIHRDDAVGVIKQVIVQGVRGEVLDVVAPVQHRKSRIFESNAQRFGFEKTQFDTDRLLGKVISSQPLEERLGYEFVHADVYGFWD
jgi:hypothetical protein